MRSSNKRIPIKKLDTTKSFFTENRLSGSYKVLDIGGTSYYYTLLKNIFETGSVYIFNSDNQWAAGSPAVVGNALQLPFANDSWEVVTAFDVIEHMIDPDIFLSECFRVLKMGGYLVISTSNLATIYNRLAVLFGFSPFNYQPSRYRVGRVFGNGVDGGPRSLLSMPHISVFTYKGLKQLLTIHGFKVLKSAGYPYTDLFYFDLDPTRHETEGFLRPRRLIDHFLPVSLKEAVLIICRK
jgi:SAM-dependent methyltransferase